MEMEVVKSLKPKEEEMLIIKKYPEMMLYVYNLVKNNLIPKNLL